MSVVVQVSDLVHMLPSISQYFQETEYQVLFHSWMFVFQISNWDNRIFFSRLKPSYLLEREKDLDGLWFLSRERDLSLLLSLEKDLGREKRGKNKRLKQSYSQTKSCQVAWLLRLGS